MLIIRIISFATSIFYLVTNILPLIYLQCLYKTPVSSFLYVVIVWIFQQCPIVLKAILSQVAKLIKSHGDDSWLIFQLPPEIQTLEGFEIYVAKRSCIKHELDALL